MCRFVLHAVSVLCLAAGVQPCTAQKAPGLTPPASKGGKRHGQLYRDPEGKFTVAIPEGWNAAANGALLYGQVGMFQVSSINFEPEQVFQNLRFGLSKQFIGIDVKEGEH